MLTTREEREHQYVASLPNLYLFSLILSEQLIFHYKENKEECIQDFGGKATTKQPTGRPRRR
jgi:hypothetical protein